MKTMKIITITTFFRTFSCWPTSIKISENRFANSIISKPSTL